MADQYVNTASTATLAADISAAATSVTLSNFSGWPASFPYWAMIAKGTGTAELVRVDAAAGSVLTIVRGQGGTVAASHVTGDSFEHVAPAKFFQDTANHLEALAAHGAASPLVGVTDTGTLTNKTYRGAHTHVYTDASPGGVSAGYSVSGDSAKASDGFVFDNTAADADRKAFLLKQGVDRVAVFNDGTVAIVPNGSATRPALHVEDGAARVTRDLATDKALDTRVTADTQDRLRIDADGKMSWGPGNAAADTELRRSAANKLDTPDSLDVGGALAVLGQINALSTVAVTGNATVGGTLGVTGATTLSSAAVSGNATVGGTLGVTGTTTAAQVNATGVAIGGVAVVPRKLYVRKTAQETVNNTSTFQDDDELFLALEANKDYEFSGVLRYVSLSSADIKIAFTVPTGTAMLLAVQGLKVSAVDGGDDQIFAYDSPPDPASFGGTTGSPRPLSFHGIVRVGGTAGNIQLRWAQNTATVGDTSIFSNSHIMAEKLN